MEEEEEEEEEEQEDTAFKKQAARRSSSPLLSSSPQLVSSPQLLSSSPLLVSMASTTAGQVLPSGGRIFTSVPDVFFIPEFVIGGLVWILVASAGIEPANPLAWVMFVSLFCFVVTTVWFFLFLFGANQGSIWPSLDVGYHFLAAVLYLSAAVPLAFITLLYGQVMNPLGGSTLIPFDVLKVYRLEIAAVVMSYVATLLYFLHAIFSAIRWKSS